MSHRCGVMVVKYTLINMDKYDKKDLKLRIS